MRFAIDGTAAVTGGGITYLLNLLPALAEVDAENEYWVYLSNRQTQIIPNLPPYFHVRRIQFRKPVVLWRVLWQQLVLPVWLRRNHTDALLAPADIAPLLAPCPTILAIRNPNPYWGPRASTLAGRVRELFLRSLTALSAARASRIFFVSDFSRQLIARRIGLDLSKTAVIYHGLAEHFAKHDDSRPLPENLGVQPPYILCVSVVRIHKDQATLIKAYNLLVRRTGIRHSLVLAGAVVDRPYYEKLQHMVECEGLQGRVQFLGEVPYAQLPCLYRQADLFVLPSLAETFGHPLVEAMASDVPVVATDLPVMREICGGGACYFRPSDPQDLAQKMSLLLENPGLAKQIREAGIQRAQNFSWQKTALETARLLSEVASKPGT